MAAMSDQEVERIFAEGRRAGLREAAEHLRSVASEHAGAQLGTVRGILRDIYRVMADELQAKAGGK